MDISHSGFTHGKTFMILFLSLRNRFETMNFNIGNIKSAPKDGTYVLLDWPGSPSPIKAFWDGWHWKDCWGNIITGAYRWTTISDPHRRMSDTSYSNLP